MSIHKHKLQTSVKIILGHFFKTSWKEFVPVSPKYNMFIMHFLPDYGPLPTFEASPEYVPLEVFLT